MPRRVPTLPPNVRRLFRLPWSRSRMLGDLNDEVDFHLEMRVRDLRALGLSEADARTEALRRFGDVDDLRDHGARIGERSARRLTIVEWLSSWAHDARIALRQFRKAPAFAAIVVLTLALGIGANAAILSFLDQVFLRTPAGVASPETLRRVWRRSLMGYRKTPYYTHNLTYHEYQAIAAGVGDDAQLALYETQPNVRIGRESDAATATVAYVTASYFPALGVHPATGRAFTDAEADIHTASRVVVVSDAFWRRRLGADPSAVGKTLTVSDRDFTVIGVAPPHFTGIDLEATDVWLPLGTHPTRSTARVSYWESSVTFFPAFARMKAGTNTQLVGARATAAYLASPAPDFGGDSATQISFRSIVDARGPAAASPELSIAVRLAFVAAIILLITVANVVNLLLARAMSRRREAAVRLSLGASRSRLMRLFIVESVLLALAAGAAALIAAQLTGNVLRSLLLPGIQFADGVLRWQVVGFTVGLSLVTGIVAGLVPAVQATKADLTLSLKAGSRESGGDRSILPRLLVGAQAALSVMLLAGAVLFVASLRNVQKLHIGFDVPRIAYASVTLPSGEQSDTLGFAATMRDVGERVRAIPGVEAVAFDRDEPMTWFLGVRFYTASDSSDAPSHESTTGASVSSDFFHAVGLSFTRGSGFSDRAGQSANAIVVNQQLAREYWPDRDAIGQCIYIQTRDSACLSVVGVVDDAIHEQLIEQPRPQLYLPIFSSVRGQRPPSVMVIRADPARLDPVMTAASRLLHDAFPRAEPHVVRMSDRLASQYRPWQLGAALFSVFGILALLVAALGIYSSVSYSVTQRTHELGVRIALGAATGDVMRHVVGRGVRPVLIGSVIGAVLAVVSARLISSLLFGIAAWNPVVLLGVVVVLMIVAVTAACIPGWRAAQIDPVRAMAAE